MSALQDRVVTVFGGSGFIGRHLVRRLAEQGATIRVATSRPGRAIDLKPMGDIGQIVTLPLDAGRQESIDALVAGADHVVNLVGILAERRKGDFEALHARLPGMIGKAAAAAGIARLVHVSALGADAGSTSLYARTKAEGEQALHRAFAGATILRPSVVFGPEDQFFNRFARMAGLSPALPVIGGGHTRFQPVYVGDVAAAIMAALVRDDAPGRTYELGGPETRQLRDILAWMLQVLHRRRLLLTIPFGVARILGSLLEKLPAPALTSDQVELLRHDNVVSAGAATLADLGVTATPMEVIVPTYLQPFGLAPLRPAT